MVPIGIRFKLFALVEVLKLVDAKAAVDNESVTAGNFSDELIAVDAVGDGLADFSKLGRAVVVTDGKDTIAVTGIVAVTNFVRILFTLINLLGFGKARDQINKAGDQIIHLQFGVDGLNDDVLDRRFFAFGIALELVVQGHFGHTVFKGNKVVGAAGDVRFKAVVVGDVIG